MRCGTEYEDTDALNFLRKIAADGLGHDSIRQSSIPSPSGLSTSRKRKVQNANSELASSFNEAANKISTSMAHGLSALASAFCQKKEENYESNDIEMRKVKRRKSLAEALVNLTKQICEIKQLGFEQQDVISILEAEKESIKKLLSE